MSFYRVAHRHTIIYLVSCPNLGCEAFSLLMAFLDSAFSFRFVFVLFSFSRTLWFPFQFNSFIINYFSIVARPVTIYIDTIIQLVDRYRYINSFALHWLPSQFKNLRPKKKIRSSNINGLMTKKKNERKKNVTRTHRDFIIDNN